MTNQSIVGIALTEDAADEIRQVIVSQKLEESCLYIRVGVTGKTARQKFILDLTEQVTDLDAQFVSHGLRIICREDHLKRLEGTTIDFRDDPAIGHGFVFDVPPETDTITGPGDHQSPPPAESDVYQALRHVIDPEVGVNVVDLGLIYGLEIDDRRVRIRMTMTTPACPLSESIKADVGEQIRQISPGVDTIDVSVVWDPPWGPDKMSPEAKRQLGWA